LRENRWQLNKEDGVWSGDSSQTKPNQTTLIRTERLLGLVVSDNERLGPAVTIIIMATKVEHEGLYQRVLGRQFPFLRNENDGVVVKKL
jgi:hypothetical protein